MSPIRVLEVIRRLSDAVPSKVISIDTYKPEVAKEAVAAGAGIINDVTGLRDPKMICVVETPAASGPTKAPKRAPRTERPIQTVGRRKEAIVRVRLTPGTGKFTLNVQEQTTVDPTMEVGEVTTTVEVQGSAALVNTTIANLGQVIENRRVLELPLNGRQATELILLSAGSTPAPPAASRRGPY